MSEDLVVESPAIGWSRVEILRRAGGRGALGGGMLAAIFLALAVPLDSAALGWACGASLTLAAGAGVLTGVAGWLSASRRPGRITVTSAEVVVAIGDDTRRVPLVDIADGWVEDPDGVRLRTKSGAVLSFAAPDAAAAEAVLRASGVSVAQRVLDVHLTSVASRTLLGIPLAVTGAALVGIASVFLCGVLGVMTGEILRGSAEEGAVMGLTFIAFMVATLVLMLVGIVAALRRPRVSIGVDGVTVRGLIERRFLPYADVLRVEPHPHGVRLVTTRATVLLPTWRRGEAPLTAQHVSGSEASRKQQVVYQRIRRSAVLRQPGGPELAMLDRGGRPLEVWRDEVRALAKEPGDYRRVQLGAQDLEGIVTDAGAPAERRIAAAMALGGDEGPRAHEQVRIAIDTCADDDLKAALEQAAEGELDADTLRKALRGV